jgi:hypothetical protein
MKRTIIATLSILVLAGCALQRADIANRARTEMVGMSKKDLLMCAGEPLRKNKLDGIELLTYIGGSESVYGGSVISAPQNSAVGFGKSVHLYCEATFAIKEGVVQKVSYQGRTGGQSSQGEQCAFIVGNCVKQH